MGLDMYLNAEKYISGYDYRGQEALDEYKAVIEAAGLKSLASKDTPSATVSVTVAYWRKANAIHNWFVQNVQDGTDDCRRYHVSQDQLRELVDAATAAVNRYDSGDPNGAAAILPPKAGFFFGGTEVDEWFAQGLRATIHQLQPLLELDPMEFDLFYQSSW